MTAALLAALLATIVWALGANRNVRAPATPGSTVIAQSSVGGHPLDSAATRGSLWVLTCVRDCSGFQSSSGELVEVDSGSGQVIKRTPVADPVALAIGDGGIWIAHFYSGTVTRVDPVTGRTINTIRLTLPRPFVRGDRRFVPDSISVSGGLVWVATARGWLAAINARTSRLVAMTPAPLEVTGRALAGRSDTFVAESLLGVGVIPADGHRLWIRRISEAGQQVAVAQLAAGGGLVWIYGSVPNARYAPDGEQYSGVIAAIDERTRRVVRTLRIAGADDSIVYGNGRLYVADFQAGLLFAIGPDFGVQRLRSVRGAEQLVAATPGALWAIAASGRLLQISLPAR